LLPRLNQHNYLENSSNLLELVSSNFADLSFEHTEYGLLQPEHFHPPPIIDCTMPVQRCKQNVKFFTGEFFCGEYAMLYNACLLVTGLYCITKCLLMLPLTGKCCCNVSHSLAVPSGPSGYIKKHKYPA
jgi:hypothetical protein